MIETYQNLSHPQRRIYYSEMVKPGTNSQSLAVSYVLREVYDLKYLTEAINLVIMQCDSFNVRFALQQGELKQRICPAEEWSIPIYDFTGNAEAYDKWLREQVSMRINLTEGLLYKFSLYRNPEGYQCIFLNAHHIIMDAFSWGLVIEQVLDNLFKLGSGESKECKLIPYSGYFAKELDYKKSPLFIEHRNYWAKKILTGTDQRYLFDHSRISDDHTSARKYLLFDNKLTSEVKQFIEEQQASPFRFFMAVTSVILSKIFSRSELTFGTPFYNRLDPEARKMVGMMVNILPFYVEVNAELTFVDLLRKVKTELKSNLTHQNYPYDLLIQDIQEKDRTNTPRELFDVVVNYQNYIYPQDVRSIEWHHTGLDSYPLIIHISERGQGSTLLLEIDARKDYVAQEEINLLLLLYETTIKQFLSNPQTAIAHVDLHAPNNILSFQGIESVKNLGERNPIWNYCSKLGKPSTPITQQQKKLIYHEKIQEREYWIKVLSRHEFTFFNANEYGDDNYPTGKYTFEIPWEVSRKLIDISNKSDERLHIILSSCLLILFMKYSNNRQVAIASTLFTKENTDNLINHFLPLYCEFEEGDTYKDLLIRTTQSVNKAIANQNYPIQYLIENDIIKSKNKNSSSFDVIVLLKNIQSISKDMLGKSQIAFLFERDNDSINVELVFRKQIIKEKEIEELMANLTFIGRKLASEINARIDNIALPYFNRYSFGIVGHDSLALSCAQLLKQRNHHISWIVCQSGSQLEKFARTHSLRTIDWNDAALLGMLDTEGLDYVIDLSDFSDSQVNLPDYSITLIRYHDSLLEGGISYYATAEALHRKKGQHGMSWYMCCQGNNDLVILGQCVIDITHHDTSGSIMMKGLDYLMKSFLQVVINLERSKDTEQGSMVRVNAGKVFSERSLGEISFHGSAEDVDLKCRALNFDNYNNPIALPKIIVPAAAIIIRHLKILEARSDEAPGTIISLDQDRMIISTQTNDVEIIIANVHTKVRESVYRVRVGMKMSLEGKLLARLNSLNQTLAGNEAFWLQRLRHSFSLSIPLPSSFRNNNECMVSRYPIELPNFAQCKLRKLEKKGDQLLVGLLSFLTRISDQLRFTVKYKDQGMSSFSTDYQIFSEYVPFQIQADPEGTIADFMDAVVPELTKVRTAITFQRDIFGRYPSLLREFSEVEDVSKIKITLTEDTHTTVVTEKDQFHFVINVIDGSLEMLCNQNEIKHRVGQEIQLQLCAYLNCLAKDVDRSISTIPLVNTSEQERILYQFNDTEHPFPRSKTLSQYFEESVVKHKTNIALTDGNESITYEQLNRRANQLAHQLVNDGLRAEQPVVIIADRSFEMIVSVVATLKAGGTYIPIDLIQPVQRMKQILNSVRASHVIVYNIEPEVLSNLQTEHNDIKFVYNLGRIDLQKTNTYSRTITIDEINHRSDENLTPRGDAEDIAYIMHTSGSTGMPKGVVVKHRPVINILEWVNVRYKVNAEDRLLFVTSIGFDLSVYDIFGTLHAGASIQIVKQNEIQDPKALSEILTKYPITIWDSAPGTLQQLVPYLDQITGASLRLVMLSGDWIPLSLPPALKQHFKNIHVLSMGGATEATIWSNYFDVQEMNSEWKSIPYGKPIQNCQYFIFDRYFNVCPINREGDLYIGGQCLAEGYLNRPDLTSERFIPNPWLPGQIMYRTGDRARWMPDGNMEFLGRLDDQVKIRGFRIEIGEIEAQLSTHKNVQEVVVVAREKDGDKHLIAYCILSDGLQVSEVRDYLSERLPAYMIPSYFVQIDEMPLTSNGKVNKKALPEPEAKATADYQPPTNELEQQLVDIWSDVLNMSPGSISIHRSFFEMGGHSFRAITMVNKLAEVLSIDVPLNEVFRQQDIKSLASFIKSSQVSIEDANSLIEL